MLSKSRGSQTAHYAAGGPVIGKVSEFMKTPDDFRTDRSNATDEVFGKGGDGQASGSPNPKPSNKQAGHGANCGCPKCRGS